MSGAVAWIKANKWKSFLIAWLIIGLLMQLSRGSKAESTCHRAFYDRDGVKIECGSGFRGSYKNDGGSYSVIYQGYTEIANWGTGPQGWQVYKCDYEKDSDGKFAVSSFYIIGGHSAESYMSTHK